VVPPREEGSTPLGYGGRDGVLRGWEWILPWGSSNNFYPGQTGAETRLHSPPFGECRVAARTSEVCGLGASPSRKPDECRRHGEEGCPVVMTG